MLFYLILHVWQLLEMHLPEPGISWKSTCQDTWLRKPKNSRKIQRSIFREISHGTCTINPISTISTIIIVNIPSHPAVAIMIVLLLVHWDQIPGVDYHLYLMLDSFIGELSSQSDCCPYSYHLWSWSIWCLVSSSFGSWGHGEVKGSLHRKQKNSYGTSGINPKDLDLLDGGSEDEIQSLTLEERTKPFVDAGVGLSIPATRLI